LLGMLMNIAAALVVSMMTAPPPTDVQDLVDDIRIPTGAGVAHEH